MSKIMTWEFPKSEIRNVEIRAILKDNEPWFIAKDIAELLGFSSKGAISNALKDLDEDELGSFKMNSTNSEDQRLKEFKIVSESGLYSLIMRSRKLHIYN
jgi:anti-repressor protein